MNGLKIAWMQLYPLLCACVPCVIYSTIKYKKDKKKQKSIRSIKYLVWTYIFILYVFMAMNTAGIGGFWDIGCYDTVIRLDEINIIPFKSAGSITYILNIIMFMPLGFLLPLIWRTYEKAIYTIGVGAGYSLLIEMGQLFNIRQTDIDDLIMNTIGTALGLFIWIIFRKIFKTKRITSVNISKAEPIILICLAILGKFFLYNWRFFDRLFYY